MSATVGYILVMLVAALVSGWLLARFTGKAAAQARDLAVQVEALRKQCEHAGAELAAAKAQIERVRGEHDEYRTRVSAHFSATSDRFRELSFQYRSLFDHLSEGARALCGGDFTPLEGDLAAGALPARVAAPADAATPTRGADAGAAPPAPIA